MNKPDLVDVYVLDIHPDNPDLYRLDGEWLMLESEEIKIDVLIWGFIPWSVKETVYRSVHGPVMKTDHGTYAVRYAGMGRTASSRAVARHEQGEQTLTNGWMRYASTIFKVSILFLPERLATFILSTTRKCPNGPRVGNGKTTCRGIERT